MFFRFVGKEYALEKLPRHADILFSIMLNYTFEHPLKKSCFFSNDAFKTAYIHRKIITWQIENKTHVFHFDDGEKKVLSAQGKMRRMWMQKKSEHALVPWTQRRKYRKNEKLNEMSTMLFTTPEYFDHSAFMVNSERKSTR